MSATKTPTQTWPTLAEVEKLKGKLSTAYTAVDEFSIRTCRLIDREEPWERQESVPAPSLEDAGVLAVLVTELEGRINGLNDWLEEFQQLRDSASTWAGGVS
jgi:hypothetical protein